MDESTYGFSKTDAESLIHIIGSDDYETDLIRPLIGPTLKYAYPPTGGIPKATYNSTSKVMTPGTATCKFAEPAGESYDDTGSNVVVENPVGAIVGASGKPLTIGLTSYGTWTVLVEDCTAVVPPSGGDEPPADPGDPGDGSTSKGIDLGYRLGA